MLWRNWYNILSNTNCVILCCVQLNHWFLQLTEREFELKLAWYIKVRICASRPNLLHSIRWSPFTWLTWKTRNFLTINHIIMLQSTRLKEARGCGRICSSRLTVVCHYLPKQSTSNLPHYEISGNSIPSTRLLSFFIICFIFFIFLLFYSPPFSLSLSLSKTQHLKYAWVLVLGRNSL